jgi:hypothetical protein
MTEINEIPIEFKNNYKLNKKPNMHGEYYEYELFFKKELALGQYHSINIYTMYNINDNTFFSFQDYIFIIENIIGDEITMNKDINITLNDLREKYKQFYQKYLNNSSIIYEFNLSASLIDFIKNKFNLKNISKAHGYFERSFSSRTLDKINSYLFCHTTFTDKAFVIRVNNNFILKFIANTILEDDI